MPVFELFIHLMYCNLKKEERSLAHAKDIVTEVGVGTERNEGTRSRIALARLLFLVLLLSPFISLFIPF